MMTVIVCQMLGRSATAIPAVAAGRVIELSRLGYPGYEGLARFATDLAAALAEL